MNMNEIPTPESDVVWSEYLKSNYCTKDVEKLRKLHCDLERRLTIAREALESITHDMGASQNIHNLCARTLTQTAPNQCT